MKLTHKKLLVVCGLLVLVGTFFSFKRDTRNFEITKNLDIFNSVFRELDLCYVDTVDPGKSVEDGINYMLAQLDPYTVYYPESKNEELKMMTTGKFAGIGSIIRFHKKKNHVVIDAPYEGMAAQKAGLQPGDVHRGCEQPPARRTRHQLHAQVRTPRRGRPTNGEDNP